MNRALLTILAGCMAAAAWTAPPAAAASTRALRAELEASPGVRVGVENLAGEMRVVPGSGSRIVVLATVNAESDALANKIRVEEVRGEKGERILRVVYPLDEHTSYRYGSGRSSDGGWFGLFGGGGGNTNTKYAGRRVTISGSKGVLLYADLEVQVPAGLTADLRNVVGRISAADVEGDLLFDSGSGAIELNRLRGAISADTGSGSIEAREISGSFSGDTGSGTIRLTGFDGTTIGCDTGSGEVDITEARAESLSADTGSGGIVLKEVSSDVVSANTGSGGISMRGGRARRVTADTGSGGITIVADGVEEFQADTGSGDVTLETDGRALRSVDVDTGSGDAEIRMGSAVSFRALAEQGSGSIRNGFGDAKPIIRDKEVVGYRRGDEKVQIHFETGSGSLILEPLD